MSHARITPLEFRKKLASTAWPTPDAFKQFLYTIDDLDWDKIAEEFSSSGAIKIETRQDLINFLRATGLW